MNKEGYPVNILKVLKNPFGEISHNYTFFNRKKPQDTRGEKFLNIIKNSLYKEMLKSIQWRFK